MTLRCLTALEEAAGRADVRLRCILVDDASADDTADAVREAFPWVEVIPGDGNLYWNRGMHIGFAMAMQCDADYYLWLNDDTMLFGESLTQLLKQSRQVASRLCRDVIMVGATADRSTGRITYGGAVARSRLRRFTYDKVWDPAEPVPCETMNGNCVLIPRGIALRVGNLDPVYEHAMGDTDYALRAIRLGCPIYAAGGISGHCASNSFAGGFMDKSLSLGKRWKIMLSRKGLPLRSWWHFTRAHGGPFWPIYFVWPYLRLVWSGLRWQRA